jgi:hypothetical protein
MIARYALQGMHYIIIIISHDFGYRNRLNNNLKLLLLSQRHLYCVRVFIINYYLFS